MKITLKSIIKPFREKSSEFSFTSFGFRTSWSSCNGGEVMIEASIIKLVLGIAVTEVQNGGSGRGKVIYSYIIRLTTHTTLLIL